MFHMSILEIAPYTTFSILLLIVISTVYLRGLILGYAKNNFPHVFIEFNLHEENEADASTLSLHRYIMSKSFENTNDPIFIAMCHRYVRWAQLFIVAFVIVLINLDFMCNTVIYDHC